MPFRFFAAAAALAHRAAPLTLSLLLGSGAWHTHAQAQAPGDAAIEVRSAQGQLAKQPASWQAPMAARMQFTVEGKYKNLPYKTKAQLDWLPQGTRYEAAQEVQIPIVGIRRQSSVGSLSAHGLQPEIFMDRGRKESSATFDPQAGQIVFSRGNPAASWAAGTQDRISVFFQVAGMLAAAPKSYPAGTQITVQAASTGHVSPWTFTVRDMETLQLPAGRIAALKLEHSSESHQADGIRSALWLAPSLQYLPVRIRMVEDDGRDELDLKLQSHSKP
jgi:hypothetical protein